MKLKPSDALRFLLAIGVAVVVLALVFLRVTSRPHDAGPPSISAAAMPPPALSGAVAPPAPRASAEPATCAASEFADAARDNAASLLTLAWAPFRRPETGWEIYAPMIAREIGAACPPGTSGFAAALAEWQAAQRLPATGRFTPDDFDRLNGVVQTRRPFVRLNAARDCPAPPADARLEWGTEGEGYGGKPIQLRPAAFAAWRAMAAAARAEDPQIAADPRNLQIFSGFRSPGDDAARCAEGAACDGVSRAVSCSPHRTGLALDMYVGQAPGFGPDSSADPNRLFMSRTATYRWLLANAHRFGFVNYPFEPWHWEWTGEAP